MTSQQSLWLCSPSTRLKIYLVLNMLSLFSGIFKGIKADDDKHFCIYPTTGVEWRKKACSLNDKGYGILIDKIKLSTKGRTFNESECSDLYDDEDSENVAPILKQMLENQCNGLDACRLGNFSAPQDSPWVYTVSYKCVRVDPKGPVDPSKPTFNITESIMPTTVNGTAVLSMRILDGKQSVNRTCHASGAKEAFTLKILHLDLIGNQKSDSCSGHMTVASSGNEIFSVNCLQTKSYNKSKIELPVGKPLTLSLTLKSGFFWLKINGGAGRFTIKCDASGNEGEQPIRPVPNNKTIPFPHVTKDPNIQPEPGKTYGPWSRYIVQATTTSQSTPKETSDSITIIVAIISVIAGVATTVSVVLAIYLCKTRDSPYQRWKRNRQSRNVTVEDVFARSQPMKYANQTDQEYAFVEPKEMTRSPIAADSGMYDAAEDSSTPLPLPPSPRQVRSPNQSHVQNTYANTDIQPPVRDQEMMYSEVVMMNHKDESTKIYAPGFYHTAGDKKPIQSSGRDTYDVLGAMSDQYAHLKDPAVKGNYLPDNVYDG